MLKGSKTAITFIQDYEGCSLRAYQDIVGIWTIGYGDTKNVHEGDTITEQEAEDRLSTRLAHEFEPGLNDLLDGAPTTQNQFDAMLSLVWNIGLGRRLHAVTGRPSGFAGSTLLRLHKVGQYEHAGNAFLDWDMAGGRHVKALHYRREAERALYLRKE